MYLRHKLVYSLGGLVLGVLSIIGGMVLFLNGVARSTDWTASWLGFQSHLNDAAPGTVLFVVGVLLVLITRHRVKVTFLSNGRPKST